MDSCRGYSFSPVAWVKPRSPHICAEHVRKKFDCNKSSRAKHVLFSLSQQIFPVLAKDKVGRGHKSNASLFELLPYFGYPRIPFLMNLCWFSLSIKIQIRIVYLEYKVFKRELLKLFMATSQLFLLQYLACMQDSVFKSLTCKFIQNGR